MVYSTRRRLCNYSAFATIAISAAFLAGCASTAPKSMVHKKRSKEYFAESKYGVKASPRVSTKRSRLRRGGGRDQVGKPYKVAGKWYYPKEDRNYKKVGKASWYGDAFHGRLTANGEVYDMTHLTAAHPTMPLPSYARVTNVKNGSSVIVRVNDRGPFAKGRIIDLSKRAAEMLDYRSSGVARVKVEYVGRAPLDGRDEQYLMASYRPGNRAPDPSDGLPSGVMIAMNGPTPSVGVGGAAAFPGTLTDAAPQPAASLVQSASLEGLRLPDAGPLVPERPFDGFSEQPAQVALAVMSYADTRVKTASNPFAALDGEGLTQDRIVASWKRQSETASGGRSHEYVAAGTFKSRAEATRLADALSGVSVASLETSELQDGVWYSVNLYSDGRNSIDDILQQAWRNGARDAMTVRD